jgi:hypothetical protein
MTGVEAFVDSMVFNTPQSPWCLVHPNEWNWNIKKHIYSLSLPSSVNCTHSCQHYYAKHALVNITKIFPRVYLIGSTWIHFGPSQLIIDISKQVIQNFGTLDWNNFGFSLHGHVDNPLWLNVTESQFRLTHLLNAKKFNLIDIVHVPDYDKSFDVKDENSIEDDLKNKNLQMWLLRTCDKHPMRKNCVK